jgi:hypothetical protein
MSHKLGPHIKNDLKVTIQVELEGQSATSLTPGQVLQVPIDTHTKILQKGTIIQMFNTTQNNILGHQLFVKNNKDYYSTYQRTSTQGLPKIRLHNQYFVPITVNHSAMILPGQFFVYKGVDGTGIPYGEILHSTFDKDVVVNDEVTDIYFGYINTLIGNSQRNYDQI